MRKILASTAAVALVLGAGAASAAQWMGTVEEINEVQRTIVVSDEARPDQTHVFTLSDMNTVGATIQDLREGDQVRIFYSAAGAREGQPTNAMRVERTGEAADAAMMGDTSEWRGTVDEVDGTTRTVTVDGQEFVIADTAQGVTVDELQPGDQVVVVYDHTGDDPEVVEITRIE